VRTPETKCSIICREAYFWLEIENPVQVKIKGARSVKIKVEVEGGKVMSVKDDIYYIRFTRPGIGAISVYQLSPFGRELIASKLQMVKNPDVYFCGIKFDSVSKYIDLNGPNLYAYSKFYKKKMDIVSFEMYYVADTTLKALKTTPPVLMKSDTCKLTAEMRKTVLGFQPKFNSIYLHNIICRVPDGSKRILDPIRLDVTVDTTNKESLSLIYSVKRKIL
jgi:hypothetical protein